MQRKTNKDFSNENLEQDLTDDDFTAMEDHLSAMEDHLFNAGVSILQAAKTQEEIFNKSIEAIQEALEPGSTEIEEPKSSPALLPYAQLSPDQPEEISLTAIWERLNKIEHRLEYLIEHLVSGPGMHDPSKLEEMPKTATLPDSGWTEKSLKKAYKTLAIVRSQLGIAAKTWKSAVNEANFLKMS
jgi:hypothetical protein